MSIKSNYRIQNPLEFLSAIWLKKIYKEVGVKNLYSGIIAIPILLIVFSCGVTVKHATSDPNIKLRDYNKVIVNLLSGTGSVERETQISGNLQNDEIINHAVGEPDQSAFQSLQFQLIAIGFQVVSDTAQANRSVDFWLGTVKYDSSSGWIANEAYLFFEDSKTGRLIEGFHAKADITLDWATIDEIISKLGIALRAAY